MGPRDFKRSVSAARYPRHMRRGVLGVLLLLVGCEDASEPLSTCVPGEVRACPCPGGGTSVQTCADDGARFGPCGVCVSPIPDAGGADAGELTCEARCAAESEHTICANGFCWDLDSRGCRWITGPRDRPHLRIGALLPLTGGIADLVPDLLPAATLAVEQHNALGGVRGLPVGLVACDTAADSRVTFEAATVLADVQVSATVGPALSRITQTLAASTGAARGLLLVSPSATAVDLRRGLGRPELVWSVAPPEDAIALPLVRLPAVRSASVAVALSIPRQPESQITAAIEAAARQTNLRPMAQVLTTLDAPPARVAEQVAATPGIETLVIVVNEPVTAWVRAIAERLPDVQIILLGGAREPTLFELVASTPALARRLAIIGPGPAGNEPAADFRAAFEARFGRAPTLYAAHAFDAAHVVIALHAAAGADATGGQLAARVPRLLEGDLARLNEDGLRSLSEDLEGGASADLEGASGPLDFDLRRGSPRSPIVLYWVGQGGLTVAGRWQADTFQWLF